MDNEKNEDLKDITDEVDDSGEKENSSVAEMPVKVNNKPNFPNQNRFGKGSFNNNNFNSRQRIGRGASRGR